MHATRAADSISPDKGSSLLLLTSSFPASDEDGRAAAGFFVRDFAQLLGQTCKLNIVTQHTGKGEHEIREKDYTVHRFYWAGADRPLSTLKLPGDLLPVLSVMLRGIAATIRASRHNDSQHVVAMWALPCGLWALINRLINRTPYTVWCLGSDIWNYRNSILVRPLLSCILKNAERVFADGYQLMDEVNRIADVGCTYLPSSRNFSFPDRSERLAPKELRHYLFVGRYHLHKGPDVLLESIRQLPEKLREGTHFHFYGGGPMQQQLQTFKDRHGLSQHVTIGGFIGEEKLVQVLAATDVVIIPSREDTISLMLSAALQANKPLITTDVGDMGYVMNKHGAGLCVKSEDTASLAKAIETDYLGEVDHGPGRAALLDTLDLALSVRGVLGPQQTV